MQQVGSTLQNEKPIEQWSKEEAKQWLETHFRSLPTLFLEKGLTGKHLVQLVTTGTSVFEKLVPDDLLRLELIDMIDKQQKGNSHIQIHNFVGTKKREREEKEESGKKPNVFLFDGKNPNEIIEFFESNYDMNEQRTPSLLVSSFGGDWPYIGRQRVAKPFASILLERFVNFRKKGQADKEINGIPFSSTIRGAGKSKANQEMIPLLQKLSSQHSEFFHKMNDTTNTYFDGMIQNSTTIFLTFLNGCEKARDKDKETIENVISYRILFEYFVQGRKENKKNKFHLKFKEFIETMWKQTETRCSIEDVLNVIERVERRRQPNMHGPLMIYLGVDEYQYLSRDELQSFVTSIGRIMSSSTNVFLAPYFTGTDFKKMFSSIEGSRYEPVDLPFLLIEEGEISNLLDQLSSTYAWLKHWRIWPEFRKHLEKFQGYMRGIEFFLKQIYNQNQILNSQSVETTEHLSKEILTTCYGAAKNKISKRLQQDKLDYSVLMRKILLQTHVQRSEQAPIVIDTTDVNILKTTYQDLENIGLVLIKSKEEDENIQYLQIPHIFGEIFTSRVSSTVPSLSRFIDVESWQQWETFQVSYLSFRHNLMVEEYGSMMEYIPLAILFQGAHFSKKTGQIGLKLTANTATRVCLNQFPLSIQKEDKIRVKYQTEISERIEQIEWKTDEYYFLNAPSSSFGDGFHLNFPQGFVVTQSFQMKHVHGNKFTLEIIQQEHKKNVEAMKSSVNQEKDGETFVVTVFFTTENLPQNIDMEALDHIIIVSRDRFEEYYGNIISRIACSTSSK
jgi:hypothetical protein